MGQSDGIQIKGDEIGRPRVPAAHRLARTDVLSLTVLALVHILSRIGYYAAGVRFDGQTFRGYWQFLDCGALQWDLPRSLFYQHSQPPLFNAFVGAVLRIIPVHHSAVFHLSFLLLGFGLTVAMLFLLRASGASRRWAVALAVLVSISPASVLYENWFFYTLPVAFLLCMSVAMVRRLVEKPHWLTSLFTFLPMTLVTLTWSAFHLVWLVVVGGFVVAVGIRKSVRMAVPVLLACVLLTATVYVKNACVFGFFGASSWLGMNMYRLTLGQIPDQEREDMIADGTLSEAARLTPFSPPKVYADPESLPKTGVPVLDDVQTSSGAMNCNHQVYVSASQKLLAEGVKAVKARPRAYLRGIRRSWAIYMHSPSDYFVFQKNLSTISGAEKIWNRVVYGQCAEYRPMTSLPTDCGPPTIAWILAGQFLLVVISGPLAVWRFARGTLSRGTFAVLGAAWLTVMYVAVLGNAVELGENNRFRFTTYPLEIACVVGALTPVRRRDS